MRYDEKYCDETCNPEENQSGINYPENEEFGDLLESDEDDNLDLYLP